jgi:hypothetical protein
VVEQRLHDAPGLLDAVLPGEVLMVAGERGVQQALVRLRRFTQLADEPGVQVNGAPGLFGQRRQLQPQARGRVDPQHDAASGLIATGNRQTAAPRRNKLTCLART